MNSEHGICKSACIASGIALLVGAAATWFVSAGPSIAFGFLAWITVYKFLRED